MRVGIVDYLLRCRESRLFESARDAGLDGVEISVERFGDASRLFFDPGRGRELLESSQRTGIAVTSVFATQFFSESLFDGIRERRDTAWCTLLGIGERASAFGVPIVVVPLLSASEPGDALVGEGLESLLVQLSDAGARHRVRFALKMSVRGEIVRQLLDCCDSEWVGVSFDPSVASAIGRDPIREWEAVQTRVFHIHMQDRTLHGAARPLGEGDCPLRSLVESVVQSEYGGPIVLHTPTGADAAASARKNAAHVHHLLVGARHKAA